MLICRQLNVWPFPNPPQTMTLAQLVLYQAGLAALNRPAEGKAKPKRLKGEAKEAFYKMVEEQGLKK